MHGTVKKYLALLQVAIWALVLASCGVSLGAGSADRPQSEIPTEFSEARADISFDSDRNLILVNLSSVTNRQRSQTPRFPCSMSIESEVLDFELADGGASLWLNDLKLQRFAELDQSLFVPGIDSNIFAVWALPELVREDVVEQTTITISDREIVFRNDCQQG